MVADSLHLYPGPTGIYHFVAASFMLGLAHLTPSSTEMIASCLALTMAYALNQSPVRIVILVSSISPSPLSPKGLAAPTSMGCVGSMK